MAIEQRTVSGDEARRLLTQSESHFLDFKAKAISPAKLTKAMSAFANADGGELFIGVSEQTIGDKHQWHGFDDQEDANGHLQTFENLFPLGVDFTYEFLNCDSLPGLVLHAEIAKTRDIRFASDGIAYLRRGAQSLPQHGQQLDRLRLNKGLTSFETHPVQVDENEVMNSMTVIEFMLGVIPNNEPDRWLKKQQLLLDHLPTVAGVLLFADEPQAILPKRCGLKIYRYSTSDPTGTRESLVFDPVTIEGPLYQQIKAAVTRTRAVVEEILVIGENGLEPTQYPEEAIHEIITNAVIHRDYSIADDIHVRIFDNRIEVQSPGTLPAHVTSENILSERFARNGQIVRIINKFPDAPNKDVGEGLNTAFEAMRKLRLKDPIVDPQENSVVVVIRHERLDSPATLVMAYLETHDQINNTKARLVCAVDGENKMKRVFERLVESGLIERIPGLNGNKAAYRKKHNS